MNFHREGLLEVERVRRSLWSNHLFEEQFGDVVLHHESALTELERRQRSAGSRRFQPP